MLEVLLALIIVMNISFFTTLIRLRLKHREVFDQLELSGFFFGSIRQLARILEFMIKRKNAELNDKFLTVSGYVFVASFLITVPFMFICVLRG